MGYLDELERKIEQYEKEKIAAQTRIEELSDYIENAPIPLHWVDAAGIIIWANQAELDLLGYIKNEYVGKPIKNFHADRQVIEDILDRLAKNETLHNYPSSLKTKSGAVKQVLISSNVLRRNGEFMCTRCFTKDITPLIDEEKRREDILRALEESNERLNMAIASTNLGTWDWYPATHDLFWSKECNQMFGFPIGYEISFEQFKRCIHPDDAARMEEAIEQAIGSPDDGQYDIIHRIVRYDDNDVRWLRGQGKVYFDEQGRAERFIGTVFDITDRKVAEEKSAKLAAIIDSSYDAIISKTLESIITSWNQSAEQIFGYSAEEMIGESILKLIPADRQDEEPAILSRLRKGERVDHFETQRLTRDGKLIDVSLTISPIIDSHGNIIGLSKIARDITEKKQEEQRKNSFTAMVSHELKTPLTSIKAYVQILLDRAMKQGVDFDINALTRIEYQVKKMISMIYDFLSLARLESGKILIHKAVFELEGLMNEVLTDAQIYTTKHNIISPETKGIWIDGDRDKLGQVLLNLVSNAIKYSPNGGTITIGCTQENGKVQLSVKDEGIGISASDQLRLFERFYRVNHKKVPTASGFGIGLYLVSEILRLHDSKIGVSSVEGAGSTFYFSLVTLEVPQ